jgi:hypothetical protein
MHRNFEEIKFKASECLRPGFITGGGFSVTALLPRRYDISTSLKLSDRREVLATAEGRKGKWEASMKLRYPLGCPLQMLPTLTCHHSSTDAFTLNMCDRSVGCNYANEGFKVTAIVEPLNGMHAMATLSSTVDQNQYFAASVDFDPLRSGIKHYYATLLMENIHWLRRGFAQLHFDAKHGLGGAVTFPLNPKVTLNAQRDEGNTFLGALLTSPCGARACAFYNVSTNTAGLSAVKTIAEKVSVALSFSIDKWGFCAATAPFVPGVGIEVQL